MSERCAAYYHGQQCRATKNLTAVIVSPIQGAYSAYQLPEGLNVLLCGKHFSTLPPAPKKESAK
jgi:hypothetical protein